MQLIPVFTLGLWNAWLFMIVFLLQWLLVLVIPKHIAEKTGHPVELIQSGKQRILGRLTEIFWIGAILLSVFLPFNLGTAWFYIGLVSFIIGLVILILATLTVFRTPADKPFTGSVYRFSRHPMYLAMILIYLGVSIATVSWLFLVITVITFFLQNYQMTQEENYCIKKYGKAYTEYVSRTPRWIGIKT